MHTYYKTKISINESNEQGDLRRPPNLVFMPWFGAGATSSGTAAIYPFSYDLSQWEKNSIILKIAMRKLIPIECSKIINMFSFKKQKAKGYISGYE